MEGQFHEHGDSYSTAQWASHAVPELDSRVTAQDWRFADQIQQLLGDNFEPDTLFLEESWTLGISAAIESWQRRRQGQAEREHQSKAFRELDSIGTLSFMQAAEWGADFSHRTAKIAQHYDADWSQQSVGPSVAPTNDWPAQNGTSEGSIPSPKVPCHWVPYGWSPWDEASRPSDTSPGYDENEMTTHHARQLLGVPSDSTREQIKSAYRQMVNQWHPDRLEGSPEEVRQLATVRMTEINRAYQILCMNVFPGPSCCS